MALKVEVVYAEPERARVAQLDMPDGASVADAITTALSRWRLQLLTIEAVGIFGEVVETSRTLIDGDRVEIYRPLLLDAKTARLKRAKDQSERSS